MRISLIVYKDKIRVPFEKVDLNAEDEADIALLAQDIETYLLNAMHDMQEGE